MKNLCFIALFCLFPFVINAQEFEVPQNFKFDKLEDYAGYKSEILKCIDWLQTTPVNENAQKRKDANAFLLAWVSGSPDVRIEIKPEIVNFVESSPELLMAFIGGWTKYAIEKKDENNKVAGNLAGVNAVMDFYVKNKSVLKKDKNVEKYLKMKEKGTLEEYISKNA
ncbi:MAG: hypothetical protein U0W24_10295 [Bacteroidales bacterium]